MLVVCCRFDVLVACVDVVVQLRLSVRLSPSEDKVCKMDLFTY
jgi:hypothetical protein